MRTVHKALLIFIVIVIILISYLLVGYGAGLYVFFVLIMCCLIAWPAMSRGMYRDSVINNPTPGAVFESGVIWLKTGSFPTIWRKGRLLFVNGKLELISKSGKIFSMSQDTISVKAGWVYPGPIAGGYAYIYIISNQNEIKVALIPPDYMDSIKKWDEAVFDKTGKHLVQKYLH